MTKMQELLDAHRVVKVLSAAELHAAHDYLFKNWSKAGLTFGAEVDEFLESMRDLCEVRGLKSLDELLHYLKARQVQGLNSLRSFLKKIRSDDHNQ